jgi:hypothetical protein
MIQRDLVVAGTTHFTRPINTYNTKNGYPNNKYLNETSLLKGLIQVTLWTERPEREASHRSSFGCPLNRSCRTGTKTLLHYLVIALYLPLGTIPGHYLIYTIIYLLRMLRLFKDAFHVSHCTVTHIIGHFLLARS